MNDGRQALATKICIHLALVNPWNCKRCDLNACINLSQISMYHDMIVQPCRRKHRNLLNRAEMMLASSPMSSHPLRWARIWRQKDCIACCVVHMHATRSMITNCQWRADEMQQLKVQPQLVLCQLGALSKSLAGKGHGRDRTAGCQVVRGCRSPASPSPLLHEAVGWNIVETGWWWRQSLLPNPAQMPRKYLCSRTFA